MFWKLQTNDLRRWISRGFVLAGFGIAAACVGDIESPTREDPMIPIPEVLQPDRVDADGDHYTLVQKESTQQVLPGRMETPILGYNGKWPGPTIIARKNRPTWVTQVNQLDRHVTVHNHGAIVEPIFDGHPADFIEPGKSKTYHYPNLNNAATYFYHDHSTGIAGRNVWWGLSGMYIIKDDLWDSFNFPKGEFEVPLVLQDRKFNGTEGTVYIGAPKNTSSDTNLSYPAAGGALGDVSCVNGVCAHPGGKGPILEVAQRRYLFRFLNASDIRIYRLSFIVDNFELGRDETAIPFYVVSSDGGLLPNSIRKKNIIMAPAERWGVVFDFSQYPIGTTIAVMNGEVQGPPNRQIPNVMQFRVTRSAQDDSSPVPSVLMPRERYDEKNADVHRTVEFNAYDADAADIIAGTGLNIFTMNGKEFDPAHIEFHPKLGTSEVWEVYNPTDFNHIIHVHLVQFQILTVDNQEPSEEYLGWKDSMLVRPKSTVKIMMKWDGFPGVYVFHCHALHHEDHHMMLQMEVTR